MSVMSHLKFFIYHFFCLKNIFQETKLSHVCHISVDKPICHFCQMWTACPEPFVPSHSHHPQLLSAAATVTATAGTATAGTATAVVNNRSRSPLVRPAASHSTADVSCHRSPLLCAVSAGTTTAVVHNRSCSLSEATHRWCALPHPHSTAAVSCHHSQLLCAVSAGTAAAVIHNRSRSLSVRPVASHSTAAVCCHRLL